MTWTGGSSSQGAFHVLTNSPSSADGPYVTQGYPTTKRPKRFESLYTQGSGNLTGGSGIGCVIRPIRSVERLTRKKAGYSEPGPPPPQMKALRWLWEKPEAYTNS